MKNFTNNVRIIIVTLLTLVLVVPAFASNSAVTVKADTQKVLLQCDEDWTILKYTDSNGNPQFDVRYRGYTYENISEINGSISYEILAFDGDTVKVARASQKLTDGTINVRTKYANDVLAIRFSECDYSHEYDNIYSEIFYIYQDKFHILSGNNQQNDYPNNSYSILVAGASNAFSVRLKVSEPVQQANIAVTCEDSYVSNYLNNNAVIRNVSFHNYSETKSVDNISYTLRYSVITFNFYAMDKYTKDANPESDLQEIDYLFNLSNVISTSGNKLGNLTMKVKTPTSSTVIIPDPDFGDDDSPTEPVTTKVEPTTTNVEPTTKKPEPRTAVAKPATPKVKVTAATKKLKVKVSKVKNQTGIQIRYKKTGAKKWTTKKYKTSKTVTKTFKKLKSNKKYIVQVRTYRTVGKTTVYSNWSKSKKVKIK